MSLKSMTGFARDRTEIDSFDLQWEVKSVNAKGLDVRCRVPAMVDGLDLAARKRAQAALSRGSVTLSLTIEGTAGEAGPTLDDAALDALMVGVRHALDTHGDRLAPPRLGDLLGVRGIVDTGRATLDDDTRAGLEKAALASLDRALTALIEARADEGRSLTEQLTGHVDTIASLAGQARACAAARPEAVKARLADKIAALLSGGEDIDTARLEQEVALLAIKQDVREELDRLETHIESARALLNENGAVGRRLDFLSQEFNREANTLCSKSQDSALTRIGLDLKAVIDQFREQLQNVE